VSRLLNPDDWKRGIALVILWAYGYQLVAWPLLFWATTIVSAFWRQFPAPPIVPWEQLFAGTATLATVGGIQTWRERQHSEEPTS
jgi:hypothetical protein